jgi:hypothetical protein
MLPLVALSFFILLGSALVTAYPSRPSPIYYQRRLPAATPHAPAYLQPYHPGLAIPPSPYPGAKPPYALSRRFIKDVDYSSGSSPPALLTTPPHKRQVGLPNTGTTDLQFDNLKEQLPPAGLTPT